MGSGHKASLRAPLRLLCRLSRGSSRVLVLPFAWFWGLGFKAFNLFSIGGGGGGGVDSVWGFRPV